MASSSWGATIFAPRRASRLDPVAGPWAWHGWSCEWHAAPGEHVLACRATDAKGNIQPEEPIADATGFGNNATQRVQVTAIA